MATNIKYKKITWILLWQLVILIAITPVVAAGAPDNPQNSIIDPTTPYSSQRLYNDVKALAEQYPDVITVSSIGESALSKDLTLIKLGNGQRKVLWVGAMHAREVVTAAYLMLTAEEYAGAYCRNDDYGKFSAENVQWLLDEFTVYIVPMVNPDGVDIVTANGSANVKVQNTGTWKSNANGVNLNRNFPFDWTGNPHTIKNNYEEYRGASEGSEPETAALIELCKSVAFEHMVSCHVQGRVVYYRDNKNGSIPGDESLARTMSQLTGFSLMHSTSFAAGGWAGGFENWFRNSFKKPAICLEFCRSSSASRATIGRFHNSDMMDWARSRYLLLGVLDSLSNLKASPAKSAVYLNGERMMFDAYSIDGNNYFKLRDLALALSGTEKQFDVAMGESGIVRLTTGAPYTPVGGEMAAPGNGYEKPAPAPGVFLLDGVKVNMKACMIGGNNYIKLRDLGQLLDFQISWDSDNSDVAITTG